VSRLRGYVGPLSEAQRTEVTIGPWWNAMLATEPEGFCDDRERRVAWENWRDKLMTESRAQALRAPLVLDRPAAWWTYDRGYDDGRPDDKYELLQELIAADELLHKEPVAVTERAREAKLRVETDAERYTPRYDEDLERFEGSGVSI
jgi:hypothetical protein